jgi:hypothetical protein
VSMKRSALIVAAVLVVSGGVWAVYHSGPRFQGSVALVDVSEAECIAMLTPQGFSEPGAQAVCAQADVWFRASVKNVGFRGAWLTGCLIEGLDSGGKAVFSGTLSVGPAIRGPTGAADHLDRGQAVSWLWFTTHAQTLHPMSTISSLGLSYRATCQPIDYGGHIPS